MHRLCPGLLGEYECGVFVPYRPGNDGILRFIPDQKNVSQTAVTSFAQEPFPPRTVKQNLARKVIKKIQDMRDFKPLTSWIL